MRFGLIGYGAWGRHHAEAIGKADDAELIAIACKREKTSQLAKQEHPEASIYRDYRDLLKRSDIDAVDIVIPTYLHSEVGIASLKAGKHVLLEKPMAESIEECDRLIDAANRSGRVLTIGHEFRLSTQWAMVKKAIVNGEIGKPFYAMVSLFRFPYRKGSNDWRYNRNMVGSWILEEPIHFFDFILWFFEKCGAPTSVFSFGNSKNQTRGLYDNFSTIVRFPNDAYAVVTQTLGGFEHHQVVEIVGMKGSIRGWWSGVMDRALEPEFGLKIQRAGRDQCEEISMPSPSGEVFELEEELRQTVEGFKTGRALLPPEEARKSVVICLEAERSLKERREIQLEW